MKLFLTFCPLILKVKRRLKGKHVSSVFENNENRWNLFISFNNKPTFPNSGIISNLQ